jgi:hypothetical protein
VLRGARQHRGRQLTVIPYERLNVAVQVEFESIILKHQVITFQVQVLKE